MNNYILTTKQWKDSAQYFSPEYDVNWMNYDAASILDG